MADVGIKFDAEGYSDFKKNLKDCQDNLRVMGSSLKEVKSEFDRNDTSIKATISRGKELKANLKAQKEQVDLLKTGVEAATAEFGENDKRTKELTIKYNNARTALNKLKSEYDDNAKASFNFGEKLKTGVAAAAKVSLAAVAALGAGIVAMTKQSVESYAEYEQLVGGVDTLFGDSSGKVQQYAADAYKTAGMSANDYMSTVTSFSASLLQSLDGDTEKAAEAANVALTDMSDNANKMGTDMSSIMQAYQSLARGNYGMLDNLKLGYGGTKTEMERLLSDAEKLSGQKYDISNLNDVYSAIHVVQTEMGITGTTAKEASETISGSMDSAKAAWSNFLTGLGSGEDVSELTKNLASSIMTVVENVIPIVQQVIGSLFGESIAELVKSLADKIKEMFTFIKDNWQSIAAGVAAIATGMLAWNVASMISGVVAAIKAFQTANEGATVAQALMNGVLAANPIMLVVTAVAALVAGIVVLWNTNEDFRNAVIGIWDNIKQAFVDAWEKIKECWDKVSPFFSAVWDSIKLTFSIVKDVLTGDFKGAWEGIKLAWSGYKDFFTGVWNGIKNVFGDAWDKFKEVGTNVINGIKEGISDAWDGLKTWFSNLWDGLFGSKNVNVNVNGSASVNGSHANGLNYVPFDGYIAELHKGEMVVPQNLANSLRSVMRTGGNQSSVTVSDLRSVTSAAVNAMSANTAQSGGDAHFTFVINGEKFARGVIRDFRNVSRANPEVIAEF